MYLHLGQDIAVSVKTIVGIFDMDTTTVSKNTRAFLSGAQKKNSVKNTTQNIPKTFVVCKDYNGDENVFLSQISSSTLSKRVKSVDFQNSENT